MPICPLLAHRADNNRPNFFILTGSWQATQTTPEWHTLTYRLPAGLTCTRCVLQLEYRTYNSCVEQCDRAECGEYADRMNYRLPKDFGPKDICPGPEGLTEMFRYVSLDGGKLVHTAQCILAVFGVCLGTWAGTMADLHLGPPQV